MIVQFYNPCNKKWVTVRNYDPEGIFDYHNWHNEKVPNIEVINPNDSTYRLRVSENFYLHELVCKCGCGYFPYSKKFIDKMEDIRKYFRKPMNVFSGGRCFSHNMQFSSNPESDHVTGWGADITISSDKDRYMFFVAALRAGINRLGDNKTIVHIGLGAPVGNNASHVKWVY